MPHIPAKKKQILKAAETLFNRHGIKRVSVEEICRTAGVSKMTFYKYFSNKIDLIHKLCRFWTDEGLAMMREIDSRDLPFIDKMIALFEWKTAYIKGFSAEFLMEVMALHLDWQDVLAEFVRIVREAQQQGQIRKEIRPEFIIAVMEKFQELSHDHTLVSQYPDILAYRREAMDFFLYGISPVPEKSPSLARDT